MFGRQFRAAKHRQHLPNPNTPGYTFELIGSTREALGSTRTSAWEETLVNSSVSVWRTEVNGISGAVRREVTSPTGRSDNYPLGDGTWGKIYWEAFPSDPDSTEMWNSDGAFDSVEEAQRDFEQFASSHTGSRTAAGKCPKCDGMGRETYETDTGSLSTQTCKACGGTGQAKEAARRTANDWEAIQDKVQLSGWDPMYADYIAWALDNDKDVTDTYSIVDYSDFMGLNAEDEKLIKKFVNVTAPKLYSKRRTAQTFTEWMAEAYPGKELLDLSRTERSKVLNEYQNQVGEGNEVWANRRTAFLDTVELTEPRHRVAGWNWDDHLNGFIAAEAAREFTCACGDDIPAPGYTDCRCGKRWNAYTINANGSQKMIAREVPVRDGVVMAGRTASRAAAYELGDISDEELLEIFNTATDNENFDVMMTALQELQSRGLGDQAVNRGASRKQAADYSNYSYDQLVDARDILRQQFANWEIDQSEYKDTLAEIMAEAESRGLTLASRKGRVMARTATRKQAADASYEGWTARIIYDEDDFEYAETTTPSGEQADSIYPMDGSHFKGGELREALEELAREWGDDAYSGTYQYNSHRQAADISELRPGKRVWVGNRQGRVNEVRGNRVTVAFPGGGIDFLRADQVSIIPVSYASLRKIAAPSSGADAIAQHFPGWRVDDDNGNFWEIHSPGGEHAFIHEEDGTYTLLMNDNTPDEFYATGLSFEDALAEVRAEGII